MCRLRPGAHLGDLRHVELRQDALLLGDLRAFPIRAGLRTYKYIH